MMRVLFVPAAVSLYLRRYKAGYLRNGTYLVSFF